MANKKRLKRLLERDNYICGAHFFGCGRKMTAEERATMDVDHIYPEAMVPKRVNSYDYPLLSQDRKALSRKLRRDSGVRKRESLHKILPPDINAQPMCRKCNQQKSASFVPSPIIKSACHCCSWVYVYVCETGKLIPIPTSFPDGPAIALSRGRSHVRSIRARGQCRAPDPPAMEVTKCTSLLGGTRVRKPSSVTTPSMATANPGAIR